MSFSVRNKCSTRRVAWWLIAAFLFQLTLPVVAQAATRGSGAVQIPFCTMQGTKLVTLADEIDGSQQQASSTQLCPFCLLQHLAQISLPVAGGLWPALKPATHTWALPPSLPPHQLTRFSLTPIRAPPRA